MLGRNAITVGRVDRNKNFTEIFEALNVAIEKGYLNKLLIVGSPSSATEEKFFNSALDLFPKISFLKIWL